MHLKTTIVTSADTSECKNPVLGIKKSKLHVVCKEGTSS